MLPTGCRRGNHHFDERCGARCRVNATRKFSYPYGFLGMVRDSEREVISPADSGSFSSQLQRNQFVQEVLDMLYYALLFLVVALIAGFLGFGGIAFAAAGIAKILFFVFLVVFIVTLIMHLTRGGTARG